MLSAVELGRSQGDVFDSEQFRSLVQADVSTRISKIEMTSLLPVALIKNSLIVAGVIIFGVIALTLFSGFNSRALFLRALLPGANLDRVSATQVKIIEPTPGDQTVAHGEVVRLVIELRGKIPNTAKFESENLTEGRRVTTMTPLGKNRYAISIPIARQSVEYRIQAGDARTRRYTLTAVARPQETAFEKTITPPAYTKIPTTTINEKHGNLSGIEGTVVELKISTDQPVSSGELRVEQGKSAATIPLVVLPTNDKLLTARLPLTANGNYRVHLVSKDKKFENKFSPEYEIKSAPDIAPTVKIDQPENDLISPSNELVTLRATATDDVGLAQVVQLIKANDSPGKNSPPLLTPAN
ncbi:MAG: hypothetical protein NTX04_07335 [Verrucomicrobia bacterium]|nr:hypothetical protein [Verrucomicrobiota bacterium]